MNFTERYQNLNKEQKEAVNAIEGPVMVIAGPGTGKTELLSMRVANILKQTDTPPESILCLTFTESGQMAMRRRLLEIIGSDAYKVPIHTFHSFGSEIISRNREFFYNSAQFEPADELKQYEIIHSIFSNLAHNNPLATKQNGDFTYLSDAQKIISELKRNSALTGDELRAVLSSTLQQLDEAERILVPVFSDRISKKTIEPLQQALGRLTELSGAFSPTYGVTPIINIICNSLQEALEITTGTGKTTFITKWKDHWFEFDENKQRVLKNRRRIHKLQSLAFIYDEYLRIMGEKGYFDYDDMVMQVVHAIEVNDGLRLNLQENYLYILIDEFQDTNLAQMRLINALASNPVDEGTANIMVVGDDDQAVYGFQGADVSNILQFSETYPLRKLIVLTENYRSEKEIIEASRQVIIQGTDRLERQIPKLNKQLKSSRPGQGKVNIICTDTSDAERQAVVNAVGELISNKVPPNQIAVLCRKHNDIESLLPFFSKAGLPVRYERQENVLELEPIKMLVLTAKIIVHLQRGQHNDAQELIPELLAHPAWQLSPETIWKLSLTAHRNHQNWLEVMATTPELIAAHNWLVGCVVAASNLPLEQTIDHLMGSPEKPESPFYSYFFSEEKQHDDPENFLNYLSALRSLRNKLSEYQPGEALNLSSFLDFIKLHNQLKIGVASHRYSLTEDIPAIQLLTAHKSKGLEFEHVFVFNCTDSQWGFTAKSHSRNISYPENLPFEPAGNLIDERLRLLYVAMTRAKNSLTLSYSLANDSNKPSLPAGFLDNTDIETANVNPPTTEEQVELAKTAWYQPIISPISSLKQALQPQLEAFRLSPTSLNTFLDVSRGGPQDFLLNELLHFPTAKSAAAQYGTAVHATMQIRHSHLLKTGDQKPLEDTLQDFEKAILNARLAPTEHNFYLQQGSEHLTTFLNSMVLTANHNQIAELDFKHQDIHSEDARITGKIDLLEVDKQNRTITVTDYKTGRPFTKWKGGKTDYTEIKAHKYKQQLIFYKILIDESALYRGYSVTSGQLAFIEPTRAGDSIVLPLEFAQEDVERVRKLITAVWKRVTNFEMPDTSHFTPNLKGIIAFEDSLVAGID